MEKNPGIIYDLGNGHYGLALNKDQKPAFKEYGKVFMRMYTDIQCTLKHCNSENGKQFVLLKHISELRQVGFQD